MKAARRKVSERVDWQKVNSGRERGCEGRRGGERGTRRRAKASPTPDDAPVMITRRGFTGDAMSALT